MYKLFLSLLFFSGFLPVYAQPWFPANGEAFNTGIIPRVDIKINSDTLDWIYDNVDSDIEFRADFIFTTDVDSDTLKNVGFRLRGNTSRQSAKKSFKVSFNTFSPGRKYNGLEKMNLNGEHNDPSVVRSHLAWNIFASLKVPSPRSNHVDVYINNQYYGLYINVEHIDEEFVESRYDNKLGNLYKCLYPANLAHLGTDKQDYKDNGYTLKTNTDKDDYSDLIRFTRVLNNTTSANMPVDIEPIFNMNGFIRYLVAEIVTGHWDAYSVNKNNYYLFTNYYTGKMEFIPYDVDNTFGIDWFNVDWATRDIYNWWGTPFDDEDRVLTSKTFGNQVYKDRFSFLLNELISNYLAADSIFPQIDALKDKISASALADQYRPLDYGWSFNDFKRSYTEALGAHVKYGLKEFISTRISSIKQQLVLNPIAPIIENVYHNFPAISEEIKIKVDITDDETNFSAKLHYKLNSGNWQVLDMQHLQGAVYVVNLTAFEQAGSLSYYIESTDASGKTSREPYSGEYKINCGANSDAKLLINEFMASNSSSIRDNYGEYEDWIEIFNAGSEAVSLSGKYLSDDLLAPSKWGFPNVTLEAGEFYIIWADKDTEQGDNHANFKLSKEGEFIGIFDAFENSYAAIDTLSYGAQEIDYSSGINTDGSLTRQDFITPAGENGSENLAYITFNYNMNKQIAEGDFLLGVDYIDIAGTFNDWKGSNKIFDGDNDGLHAATFFGFNAGEEVAYKARILADWSGGEFYELGGDGNRIYTTQMGSNVLSHWFNDESVGIQTEIEALVITVFPNPISDQPLTIHANLPIEKVNIYNATGILLKSVSGDFSTDIVVNHELSKGIYIVETETKLGKQGMKIVVY